MDIKDKINIWNNIIAMPKEAIINYEDIINNSFKSCDKGEDIFNIIENNNGETPLLLAQRAKNVTLANIILRNIKKEIDAKSLFAIWSSSSSNAATPTQPKQLPSKEKFIELAQEFSSETLKRAETMHPTNENKIKLAKYLNNAFNVEQPKGTDIFAANYPLHQNTSLLISLLNISTIPEKETVYFFKDQINIQSAQDASTALIYAINTKRFALAQEMIENGADLNLKNKAGKTALDIARETIGAVKVLRSLENKINSDANKKASLNLLSNALAGDFAGAANSSSSFANELSQQNFEATRWSGAKRKRHSYDEGYSDDDLGSFDNGELSDPDEIIIFSSEPASNSSSSSSSSNNIWQNRIQNQQNDNNLNREP